MFKSIIPNLVSFETSLNKVRGFNLAENFNFYEGTDSENIFHYKLCLDEEISIPSTYTFRNGYYFKAGDLWYYERKIWGNISLKLKYDPRERKFSFNKIYSLIPFELGGIHPVGRHISDFINLDLFLEGYYVFRGCAVRTDNKNICIISPGLNGKTTFIEGATDKGAEYISEDMAIINFDRNEVYPTGCHERNYGRRVNRKLHGALKGKNIAKSASKIDRIFLVQNSTNSDSCVAKDLRGYLFLCSLFFLKSDFVRAYMVENKVLDDVNRKVSRMNESNDSCIYLNVKDYDFRNLLKSI